MKKFAALIALLICIALLATGCGGREASTEATKLSFADSASLDALKALDGKPVTITGYMATLSPLSGEYIYLMNMPYQSCPFCVPNTTQLANTIVFAVLIVVLLVKPAGLLGKYVPEKV